MLHFWSLDGIQIFSLDLVFDFLIGQHLVLLIHRKASRLSGNQFYVLCMCKKGSVYRGWGGGGGGCSLQVRWGFTSE